jgi:hypothetical protein
LYRAAATIRWRLARYAPDLDESRVISGTDQGQVEGVDAAWQNVALSTGLPMDPLTVVESVQLVARILANPT